jgi:hypothetical protein
MRILLYVEVPKTNKSIKEEGEEYSMIMTLWKVWLKR